MIRGMFMDIEKLLALFPQANLGEKQIGAISFRQGDAFLNIPAAELSEKERRILEIFLGKTADFEVERGAWQDYLTKKSDVKPVSRGKIRFIQYEIHSLNQDEFDMELFKKAFSALFPKEPESVFLLSENSGTAVEKINAASFDKDDFKGIIQALDADLGASCRVFVGHVWDHKEDLRELFSAERRVFLTENPSEQVFDLSEVALHYYCHERASKSLLAQRYHQFISEDLQLKKIVAALYHEKGNVSSAAKKLYLHRNTLQYRIDRLRQETGLNLRRMDDLVFCYLMLQ